MNMQVPILSFRRKPESSSVDRDLDSGLCRNDKPAVRSDNQDARNDNPLRGMTSRLRRNDNREDMNRTCTR